MKMLKIVVTTTIGYLLASCSSGYSSFYKPVLPPELVAQQRATSPPVTPIVEYSAPAGPEVVLAAYSKRGYGIIGYSSFNSGRSESEKSAVEQGRKVGADLVLILNPQYTGTITSSVPITTPTTTTSYTSGSASAYGPSGAVTAIGSSTTTTHGTQTTYIPMSVNRYDYTAVYFIKNKIRLGIETRDLTNDERQAIESNQGAFIAVVVDGSPAFNADILPGDILIALGGTRVLNGEHINTLIPQFSGQQIEVSIIRKGQAISKSVRLNH